MPTISGFLGIVIRMYYRDHAPPHFHAYYQDHEAKIAIDSGEVIAGSLPRRALALVREWTDLHRSELLRNWTAAEQRRPLDAIEPLE
jgi:Domain of unknown function (DUF4160)